MIVLTIRTDKPEAEVGLYEGSKEIAYKKWQADRELTKTIHLQMRELLNKSSKTEEDIQGVVVFKGPGSFTGLRIGLSVANALAYSKAIPIVATSGKDWLEIGIKELKAGWNDKVATADYGRPPNITKPKK